MKTILFIAMSIIALLFTSCEKDEMGIGETGTGSGGMENGYSISKSKTISQNNEIASLSDVSRKY